MTAGGEDASMGQGAQRARKTVASNQNLQFTWRNSELLKSGQSFDLTVIAA
jgi:hypothetical protein